MEVGNVISVNGEGIKATVIKPFSDQSSIIEGEADRIHFVKLVSNDDIKDKNISIIDWSLFF